MKRLATILVLLAATTSFGQDVLEKEQGDLVSERGATHVKHIEEPTYSHPTVPGDARWAFPVVMLIAVLFVSAACIGWYIRLEMPEELPPTHSHDEPPGSSGRHGHGGTKNPAPDHAPDH